jgi:hypothetical protein
MKIDQLINAEIKQKLIALSFQLKLSNTDKQRALLKGKDYAYEITKIRYMTKRELIKYINKKESEPGVQLGYQVAKNSSAHMYRLLDYKVRQDIELINYARNRLYAS